MGRLATCHPTRLHKAHGQCAPCYNRQFWKSRPERRIYFRFRRRLHRSYVVGFLSRCPGVPCMLVEQAPHGVRVFIGVRAHV
jgi:hypothetical protein